MLMFNSYLGSIAHIPFAEETREESRVITALQGAIELQHDIDPFCSQIDQVVIEDVVG